MDKQLCFRPGDIHGGPSLTLVAAAGIIGRARVQIISFFDISGIPTFGKTDPGPHAPRVPDY